ncbi:hypothetical protein EDC18_11070 [Natranaerovirga pectinivora]|uniref:Permuted papain-like amidase YaeF/Yiix C92 family enzyme n=1 Tax=Natranaerovirga pectinivora TaxID=682400 RepID=A0A4R3MI90_9FIRM|nr:hypothetical protein [Natranaerovirga pectinivora]TCT12996.1 hypothetical protein EDC18_11070 [Natranaerovirga pectinivora]
MNDNYIYLVFSKTGTWLSRGISFFSKTKFVHTSLSFDNSFKVMYSFGRIHPDKPFTGGFAIENLYDGVYQKSTYCECMIYKIRVTREQYLDLQREVSYFCENKKNFKYNFLGLFGVLLNRPVIRKNYYFCTQFVSEVLINSNIYKSEKIPALIKTTDLMDISNMELVYNGPIHTFNLPYEYSDLINTIEQVI